MISKTVIFCASTLGIVPLYAKMKSRIHIVLIEKKTLFTMSAQAYECSGNTKTIQLPEAGKKGSTCCFDLQEKEVKFCSETFFVSSAYIGSSSSNSKVQPKT